MSDLNAVSCGLVGWGKLTRPLGLKRQDEVQVSVGMAEETEHRILRRHKVHGRKTPRMKSAANNEDIKGSQVRGTESKMSMKSVSKRKWNEERRR